MKHYSCSAASFEKQVGDAHALAQEVANGFQSQLETVEAWRLESIGESASLILKGRDAQAEISDDMSVMGFRIGDGLVRTSDAEWDMLREQLKSPKNVKAEVVEVDIRHVFFTQRDCSSTFRDGTELAFTIKSLAEKRLDPLKYTARIGSRHSG